jgi:hypothetical protein
VSDDVPHASPEGNLKANHCQSASPFTASRFQFDPFNWASVFSQDLRPTYSSHCRKLVEVSKYRTGVEDEDCWSSQENSVDDF